MHRTAESITRVFYGMAAGDDLGNDRLSAIRNSHGMWKDTRFLEYSMDSLQPKAARKKAVDRLQKQGLLQDDEHVLLVHADCTRFDGAPPQELLDLFWEHPSSPVVPVVEETHFPHHLQLLARVLGVGYMFAFDTSRRHESLHFSRPIPGLVPFKKYLRTGSYWDLTDALAGSVTELSPNQVDEKDAVLYRDVYNELRIAFPKRQLIRRFGKREYLGAASITDGAPLGAIYQTPEGPECIFDEKEEFGHYLGTFIDHEFSVLPQKGPSPFRQLHSFERGTEFFYYSIMIVTDGEYDFPIKFTDDQKTWRHTKVGTVLTENRKIIHGRQALNTYYSPSNLFTLGEWKGIRQVDDLLLQKKVRGFLLNGNGQDNHHAQ